MRWLEDEDDDPTLSENSLAAFIVYLHAVLADFRLQIPPASAGEETLLLFEARVEALEHDFIFQAFYADDFIDRMLAGIVFLFISDPAHGSGKGAPTTQTIEWNQLAHLLDGGRYWNYGVSRRGWDESRVGILMGDPKMELPFTKFVLLLFQGVIEAKKCNPWSEDHKPWHTADPNREWTADRFLARMITAFSELLDDGRLSPDSSFISFDQLTEIMREIFWWDGLSAKSK